MVVVKANGQGRVSIHAPHARGDRSTHSCRTPSMSFNPRPSCEGRLLVERRQAAMYGVSIHAPHARGDLNLYTLPLSLTVSIHAPHARGDS